MNDVTAEDEAALGRMFTVAAQIAKEKGIDESGYRPDGQLQQGWRARGLSYPYAYFGWSSAGSHAGKEGLMQFIVFTGLPGTGKTTLAEIIGRDLNIPVFAKDWLEAAIKGAGIDHERLGYAGYELLTTLAQRQLMLGQSVILDSVASDGQYSQSMA